MLPEWNAPQSSIAQEAERVSCRAIHCETAWAALFLFFHKRGDIVPARGFACIGNHEDDGHGTHAVTIDPLHLTPVRAG
ncbi:MAG: hypothetical protein ABI837_14940 [Acidobacteriota bacterium]